jgi:hypothetical protein
MKENYKRYQDWLESRNPGFSLDDSHYTWLGSITDLPTDVYGIKNIQDIEDFKKDLAYLLITTSDLLLRLDADPQNEVESFLQDMEKEQWTRE